MRRWSIYFGVGKSSVWLAGDELVDDLGQGQELFEQLNRRRVLLLGQLFLQLLNQILVIFTIVLAALRLGVRHQRRVE